MSTAKTSLLPVFDREQRCFFLCVCFFCLCIRKNAYFALFLFMAVTFFRYDASIGVETNSVEEEGW